MNLIQKTKIVATIGPASSSKQVLREMMEAGVSVFRINGAHGTFEEHSQRIANIRGAEKEIGRPAAIMIDLPGPKYRLGKLSKEPIELEKGQTIVLHCGKEKQTDERIPLPHALHKVLKKGDKIFMNDGTVGLVVASVQGDEVHCKVTAAGEIRSKKGVNLPGVKLVAPSLTPEDKRILDFAIREDVDFISLSFVRTAENIEHLRKILKTRAPHISIISKIEKPEAIDNLDPIIKASDAVMIARGDLGIEMPFEKLPIIQREILSKAACTGKPVIVATQMLESMVSSKRPTRAEATDVAEAVWGGADAVMLSEETSIGISPPSAVDAMARIAAEAENLIPSSLSIRSRSGTENFQAQTLAMAAALVAEELSAKAIATPTRSGRTPFFVGRQRPKSPIFAPTENIHTARKMCLFWGVRPMTMKHVNTVDEMLLEAAATAHKKGFLKRGDLIVIASGAHGTKDDVTRLVEVRKI